MKYQLRLLVALSLFAPILAFACGGDGGDSRLRVVATTTQIGDFARQAGGERIPLTVLLKPNQDAHDFEPQPSQVRALERADLVLRNGIGLDAFVEKALKSSDADVVVVTPGGARRGQRSPLERERLGLSGAPRGAGGRDRGAGRDDPRRLPQAGDEPRCPRLLRRRLRLRVRPRPSSQRLHRGP